MKFLSTRLRLGILAGIAASLALQPALTLRAGDHGGGDDGGGPEQETRGETEFLGTIQALPATTKLAGTWTVNGRAVQVTAFTRLRTDHGAPVIGGKVEVEGILLADGSSVQASSVQTEDAAMEFEDNVFFGTIQALPPGGVIGTWEVSGLTVLVSSATQVETEAAAPLVGSTVRVEGVQQGDASIVASEVTVQATPDPAAPAPANVKLQGTIQQLPATPGVTGNWITDDVVVTVTDDSVRVEGGRKPKVGRQVTVHGAKQINGSVLASKVNIPKPVHHDS